ncbi:MAG TPA: hypothetical protein VMF30_03575 [Pirellulales bacterium]|nr:hypothetical protein [Pirellulales bacterium]
MSADRFRTDLYQDGYTERGWIAAVAGRHDGLRFDYRPVLAEERHELAAAAAGMTAHEFDARLARFVAQRIVGWDRVDALGQPAHVSAAAVQALPGEMFVRLGRIVLGTAASDIDPAWPAGARERLLAHAAEAAARGRPIGEVREENDEKNCCWG